MRINIVIPIVLMFSVCGYGMAAEHDPCKSISIQVPTSAQALRNIAADCRDDVVSTLFYHRAYHAELVQEHDYLSRLHSVGGQGDGFLAYRIYMAMVEMMAEKRFDNPHQRAGFLNAVYQRRNEIAELRLRGFQPKADWLEKRARSN